MRKVMCTAVSLGVILLVVSIAPDIRRYLRMRAM